mmetsp:Transcript_78539/g.243631  ORF Transcript_78539/g.243631 Transcript_78539/m.243631 type:complete len:453 (-) Transcript_78539:59-1417(-)
MTLRGIALLACALLPGALGRLGQSRQPFLVKLWKEHARSIHPEGQNITHEANRDHGRGYFVGKIMLGSPEPQEMHVVFSTTTGMVSLPSSNCASTACQEHHRYSPAKSETSVDVQRDGSPVDPNGGRMAPAGVRRDTASLGFYTTNGTQDTTGLEGNFVAERLCMGDRFGNAGKAEPICAKVSLVVATTIQEATFRTRPQDGLVGLSLQGLSIAPHFNVLNCLSSGGLQSHFGFFVEDDAKNAEIVFGGYDRERLAAPLAWVPLAQPALGHWLVDIKGVTVGSKRLAMCQAPGGCRGMLDTSSPGITMPEGLAPELMALIEPEKASGKGCTLPEFSLELAGGVTLTLRVEDYAGPRCEPEIRTHHFGQDIVEGELFLLGEPVLRRYYTVFDWGRERLGFAMANVERSCQRLHNAGLPTAPGSCQGSVEPLQDAVVMLEQEQEVTLRFHRQEA